MPRKPRSRRSPNRGATRKDVRPRPSVQVRAEDAELIRWLREVLHSSPVEFGAAVCQVVDTVKTLEAESLPALPMFVESMIAVDIAETTNALHVLTGLVDDAELAARIQAELERRRQPVPKAVRAFTDFAVVDAVRVHGTFVDGEHVSLLLRWPDGTQAAMACMIKYVGGGYLGDAFLDPGSHETHIERMAEVGEQYLTGLGPIALPDARARLEQAVANWDAQDLPDRESWPALRPFLQLALDRMPEGGQGLEDVADFDADRFWSGLPDGRHAHFALPEPPDEPVLATMRIDLHGAKPPVWRRVEIRSDCTLADLSDVIMDAFGWEGGHLHCFWEGGAEARWGSDGFANEHNVDDYEQQSGPREHEVRIDQVLRAPGEKLFYVYDFGDDWGHLIKLESTRPLQDTDPVAALVAGRRAGPLEDSGGIHAHNELVAWLAKGGHASLPEDLQEWVPEDYDPARWR